MDTYNQFRCETKNNVYIMLELCVTSDDETTKKKGLHLKTLLFSYIYIYIYIYNSNCTKDHPIIIQGEI